jgi:hypothetical protein
MVTRKFVISALAVSGWLAVAGLVAAKLHETRAAPPPPSGAVATTSIPTSAALLPHPVPAPTKVVTAESEREVYLRHLAATGPAARATVDATRAVVDSWHLLSKTKKEHSTFGKVDCYQAGCTVTLQHPDLLNFQSVNDRLTATPEFVRYPGSKWRSGPITRKGIVETSWIFFAPDPPEHARNAPGPLSVPPASSSGTPG